MSDSPQTESNPQNTKADKNNSTRRYLRRIAVWAAIAYLILLLLSIFWPNLAERTKFFTGNGLTLALLIVAIAQALIYYRQQVIMQNQWEAMDVQKGTMKDQLTAMQDSLEETRNIVRQNERAVAASEAQAAASQAMVEANIESFYVSEQPYIALEKIRFITPMSVGRPLDIELIYRNCGRTPAFNFFGFSQITVSDQPASEALKKYPVKEVGRGANNHALAPNLPQRMTLVSDADFLNQERFDVINDGTGWLYIFLRARYRDFRQTEQSFSLDLVYHPAENRFGQAE